MSDSVRPHRRQPTRLPRPWASPSKNTGVGCHFLLQCMKVKSEREVAQSCPTLSDPMDCSPPGPSVHGIDSPGKSTGVGCHLILKMQPLPGKVLMHRSRKRGKCNFFFSIVSFGLTALVTNETHLFPEGALKSLCLLSSQFILSFSLKKE